MLLLTACSENELVSTKDDPEGTTASLAPDVAVEPAEVDFGEVRVGEDASAVLTISNVGDADLHVRSLALAGDSYDVDWTALSSPVLAPGDAVETIVTWTPLEAGRLADALEVPSDDPDEPVVSVPLTGLVPAGDLAVEPATYDFGTLEVGSVATTIVTVSNVGDGPIVISDWEYTANDGDLTVLDAGALAALPLTLDAGDATDVTIQYAPSGSGQDEGAIAITSDDPDTPVAGADQWGNGEEPDPCDGFAQTVSIFLTADDSWQGWVDGTEFTAPNQSAWNAFDTVEFELACGDHALSLYAKDTGLVIAGVIAVVSVEGVVRFVSGPTDWTMTDTTPPSGWTDPAFDDSAWHIPEVCADTSPWGSTPQPFYDLGARWIWWTTACRDLGEAWLRLNFTVP
ncbi:MAG: choice-of-anchor D domain-containing protein [Myxococcota bacterium]